MYLINRLIPFSVLFLTLCLSCRKSEIAITPTNRGDLVTAFVNVNPDYKQQVFFSLSQNRIISSNYKTAWDLCFVNKPDGYHVKINTSKAMSVWQTTQTEFSVITDTIGFSAGKRYDSPTGNLDSTAVGDWQVNKPVYIVDCGFNEAGTHLGFKKIQITQVDNQQYQIKLSAVNSLTPSLINLTKQGTSNFVYVSFAAQAQVNIEPSKTEYDLVFTQYTHIYTNPFSTYLVMGVLNNPLIKSAQVNNKKFSEISITDTATVSFSNKQNVIGYDWKTYNFQTSSYAVNSEKCYLLKSVDGYFYKLHFIDFYNSTGVKGYPKFEFKKL